MAVSDVTLVVALAGVVGMPGAPETQVRGPQRMDRTPYVSASGAFLDAWGRIEVAGSGTFQVVDVRRPASTPTVTLVVYDTVGLNGEALVGFEDETRKMLGEPGIETRLLWDPEAFPWDDPVVLRVLIRDQEPNVMSLPDDVLGATYGVDSDSIIQLFLPPLTRTLGLSLDGSLEEGSLSFGRALARVLVHEIVHALAPEVDHRPRTIMGHVQHRRYLLLREVRLGRSTQEALLRGLAVAAR